MTHPASPSPPHLASPSGGLPSAVRWAQLLLADRLRPGEVVVDATLGNGHDTLFLTHLVMPGGRVYGFDIQAEALESTRHRLREAGVSDETCTLILAGHEHLAEHLPVPLRGHLDAVMFNLGWLPGSDKRLTTTLETTLQALESALEWLAPGALMTVVVYPGHPAGALEADAVSAWAAALDPRLFEIQQLRPVNRLARPPECWVVWKNGASP